LASCADASVLRGDRRSASIRHHGNAMQRVEVAAWLTQHEVAQRAIVTELAGRRTKASQRWRPLRRLGGRARPRSLADGPDRPDRARAGQQPDLLRESCAAVSGTVRNWTGSDRRSYYHYMSRSRREETVSAADANRRFSELLRNVRDGRRVIVTSHGRPVAKIVPIAEHDRTARGARAALLSRLRAEPVVEVGRWTRDELYEDVR